MYIVCKYEGRRENYFRLFLSGSICGFYEADEWPEIARISCIKDFAGVCGVEKIQWAPINSGATKYIIVDERGRTYKRGRDVPSI